MAFAVKNSLFVRNLSPDVSESHLREVFGTCDEIELVTFKPYNTLSNQFFAQVDFKSSKGIIEGSKLSGSSILGVPCVCGVIDPLASPGSGLGESQLALGMDAAAIQAEFARRTKEAEEDQRFRTVHIGNIGMDMSHAAIRTLCKNFGEVDRLRVDEDDLGQRFALCEFRERGPAHVCKMQQQYLVNGRVLYFTEAMTMVDACSFAERTVQFEDTYLHAMAMRSQLTQPGQMNDKLALVRAAAEAILPAAVEPACWGYSRDGPKDGEERNKKDKKDKKEKKEKKKEKKIKKEKEQHAAGKEQAPEKAEGEEDRSGSNERRGGKDSGGGGGGGGRPRSGSAGRRKRCAEEEEGLEKKRHKRRRRRRRKAIGEEGRQRHRRRECEEGADASAGSGSATKAEMVESESSGPVDLDEVEVVGTELVVMGTSSSSSSSTTEGEVIATTIGRPRVRKAISLDLDGGSEVVSLDEEAQDGAAARGGPCSASSDGPL